MAQITTKEVLIRKKLLDCSDLTDMLSDYDGTPAVFLQQAPSDTDCGWNKERQYPRIEFNLSTMYAPEREQSGSLVIDVVCSQIGATPEDIEPIVRKALAGVFFVPNDGYPFNLTWKNTRSFTDNNEGHGNPLKYGVSLSFDVNDFPNMEVASPDPVGAVNNFLHLLDENIIVIGTQYEAGYIVPTRKNPVVWVRRISTRLNSESYACEWLDTTIAVHVFAPLIADRQIWVDEIMRAITYRGEIIMMDGSPMLVTDIDWDFMTDELNGQLRITFRHGRLRCNRYKEILRDAFMR